MASRFHLHLNPFIGADFFVRRVSFSQDLSMFHRRNLAEDARAISPRLCDPVPGFIPQLHIPVQHAYETHFPSKLRRDRLLHEIRQDCEA